MKNKLLFFAVQFMCFGIGISQPKLESNRDLINSLFSSRDNNSYLLPAIDSSICIIRQEYTLIDSNDHEFGANGKSYWGIKYSLGVITDSGIYTLGTILWPWAGDKDLEELAKTDTRHLQPYLSMRLYKRPMDNSFVQWKNDGNSRQTSTSNNLVTPYVQERQAKAKKGKNKKVLTDTVISANHSKDTVSEKRDLAANSFTANENLRIYQDSALVSFIVSDSIPSVPLAIGNIDTTGWLVIITRKYNAEISDTSQLAYTIIKPSYTTNNSRSKLYIKEPATVKQNLLGGIYYIAHFSCGKIFFSAAGLLNRDEKGWFINDFTSKMSKVPAKPTTTAITPIKDK